MPSIRDLPSSSAALWLSLIATLAALGALAREPLADAYDARWPLVAAIAVLSIAFTLSLLRGRRRVRIVNGHDKIHTELTRMVGEASTELFCVGSRSRDADYLKDIEERIRNQTSLRHYRVLCGEPRHEILKRHAVKLIEMRAADSQSAGRIRLGMCPAGDELEPAVCVTEDRALVVVPALGRYGRFDSAIVLSRSADVKTVRDYVETMLANSRELTTVDEARALQVPA